MEKPMTFADAEALYAVDRRRHRYRAWLVVNDPEVLALLDRKPRLGELTREELAAFGRSQERYRTAMKALRDRDEGRGGT
jgi:hypothetical protein